MTIPMKLLVKSTTVVILAAISTLATVAQVVPKKTVLTNAPAPRLLAQAAAQSPASPGVASRSTMQQAASTPDPQNSKPKLTVKQAEQMAIKNNPQVSVAHLLALAQHQVTRETRAAELPTGSAAITAVDAEDATRISAGSLTASRLFEHAGAGGGFSQLITDFGKTRNMVASSILQEKAQNANAIATQYEIQLATDQAFYNALQAQQTLQVAQQNVTTRQAVESQVSQMTASKLKSTLDLSFADVNLSQAKLLALDAQNNAESAMAALDAILGLDHQIDFDLIEDGPEIQQPPPAFDQLVSDSLKQRPDLQASIFAQQASVKFSKAERDQSLPSIAVSGTAGSVPIRPSQYYVTNWWGAIGVNLNIPIFNGFLYSAQAKEASIRAQAAAERTRDLRDTIVRDVRTSWLAANTSFQRVAVTGELLKQANLALSLAQTRYQMGLSSIVELSQAEYQQTDAAIGNSNAQYQYRLALATLNYQVGANP
jgi:outer membrane protein